MPSPIELGDNEVTNPLPPLISNNLREKLEAEQISINGIIHHKEKLSFDTKEEIQNLEQPKPKYGLEIVWLPNVLDFHIDDEEIVLKLRIWNVCMRSIYLHCCGFWDESCRLGANWRCYPRTRFLLAPGLTADIYVKAEPRDFSPIPSARIGLQLAAAHQRDHVVGYFVVPINAKFLKYIPPSRGEGG